MKQFHACVFCLALGPVSYLSVTNPSVGVFPFAGAISAYMAPLSTALAPAKRPRHSVQMLLSYVSWDIMLSLPGTKGLSTAWHDAMFILLCLTQGSGEEKETIRILISTSLIKAIYRVNFLSQLQLTLNYRLTLPRNLTCS